MTARTAIVTGGAGTLGLAIGKALAADGWPVLLADITDRVEAEAAEFGARGLTGDLTRQADREALIAAAGPVGALVNCAGIGRVIPFLETDEETWRGILEINLTVPMLLTQAVCRQMAEAGGGRIVNIASVSGEVASRGRVAYGTSKAGIIHMTRQIAVEMAAHGITCNAVAPGPVEGPMAKIHPPDQVERYLNTIPQGRYARAEEIADAVRYLASPGASHITGHCLNVDGGFSVAGV